LSGRDCAMRSPGKGTAEADQSLSSHQPHGRGARTQALELPRKNKVAALCRLFDCVGGNLLSSISVGCVRVCVRLGEDAAVQECAPGIYSSTAYLRTAQCAGLSRSLRRPCSAISDPSLRYRPSGTNDERETERDEFLASNSTLRRACASLHYQ
jgi:hypothetical protein